MNSDYNLNEHLTALKAEVKEWSEIRLKLIQMQVYVKSATLGSFLIYGVTVINLLFFALLFAFVALGLLMGKWVNSVAGGFVIISSIYLLSMALMLIFHKRIFTGLQNLFLKGLSSSETEDESTV